MHVAAIVCVCVYVCDSVKFAECHAILGKKRGGVGDFLLWSDLRLNFSIRHHVRYVLVR